MQVFEAIILGFVQGITEFIPISSSGHLIVFRDFLGQQVEYGLAFDAVLQLATTIAILVYFWKDICRLVVSFFKLIDNRQQATGDRNMILAVIVGTIPAVILGILLEDWMDTIFRNSKLVIITLIVGALVMWAAEKMAKYNKEINWRNGFWIGCFQALALIPGMSRSGMTISGGLFLGIKREQAVRFSFILALPVLLGSGLKKLWDLSDLGLLSTIGGEVLIGSTIAFVVGLVAIHFLIKYLRSHSLNVFVWYRIILAIILGVSFYF